MRFTGIFYAVFIPLTLTVVMSGRSGEMVAYAVFSNLLYAVVGGIGWVVIDRFIGFDTWLRAISSFLSGLVILNLTAYYWGTGRLLTLTLFEKYGTSGAFAVSLTIHIAFLLSFLAAWADKRRYRIGTEE